MFLDWVLGALIRPAATFERARHHLRFGYWWIFLSVLTLETVMLHYGPSLSSGGTVPLGDTILYTLTLLMLIFDVQAINLFAAARIFRWSLSWADAMKFTGLCWSYILLEDVAAFYPALIGDNWTVFLIGIPMSLLYLLGLTLGVRSLTGFAWWKAASLALVAILPWRIPLFLLSIPAG